MPDHRHEARPIRTSWMTVILAISAGLLAAFQVGKVHIALSSVRQSFSLDLISASWILSALNIVGLFAAIPTGTLGDQFGNKRIVIAGLLFIAVASALGGFAPSLRWLLLSRLIEGIGFVMVVVAAPTMIAEATAPENLRLALAGWSAYMPGGIALITFLAPLILAHHTWRRLWWIDSATLLAMAAIIGLLANRSNPAPARLLKRGPIDEIKGVLTARGPMLLALIFGAYTMQHLSVMGFLPTFLRDRFHLSEAAIGLLVSIAMASNILGNLAAGVLLQRGASRTRIIAWTSIFMACMTVAMFVLPLTFPVFYGCAFAFSSVGGLVPSCVMGAAPFHTPEPSLLGATNGLLVQGSNLGTVIGPLLMSLIVTHFGWKWVPVMTGFSAAFAVLMARNLRLNTHSRLECAVTEAYP